MERTFAPLAGLTGLIAIGLFFYAVLQFGAVQHAFMSGDGAPDGPIDVEAAAPETAKHRQAFKDLVAKARWAVANCPKRDAERDQPTVRGKALIWDDATDTATVAHAKLPADIRPVDAASDIALFLIIKQDEVATGQVFWPQRSGDDKGILGYRVNSDICVIQMPEAKPIGKFRVEGNAPEFMVRLDGSNKVVGNWTNAVKKWAEGVTRGPEWREKTSLPPGEYELKQLAAKAKPAIPQCQSKRAGGPIPTLAKKALLWSHHPNPNMQIDFIRRQTQKALPPSLQAGPDDTAVVVFFFLESKYGQDQARNREWFDEQIAVVAMPGARPIGLFTVRSIDRLLKNRPEEPSDKQDKLLAEWVENFLDNPQQFVKQPAARP